MKLLPFSLVLACSLSAFAQSATNSSPVPLVRAHAHNDYEHTRPLFDALDQGFCSVEADIHLVDGKLLVAHDLKDVKPDRTLEALYLEPLRARVKKNGGRVYADGPECTLLIDFKNGGEPMYNALREVLKKYSEMLTVFRDGKKETNAITVILTGSYPRELLAADAVRYAAGDGKLPDLEKNPPANLVPWISEPWPAHFKWIGKGPFPVDEKEKLEGIVAKAHAQGRRVRFWGAPDNVRFWRGMIALNVDLINTDDLKGLAVFMHDSFGAVP